MSKLRARTTLFGLVLMAACNKDEAPPPSGETPETKAQPVVAKKEPELNRIDRETFNRLAAELALPIFWIDDAEQDGKLTVKELAVLWRVAETQKSEWVANGAFTDKFLKAYDAVVARKDKGTETDARLALVRKELGQGRPTIVYSDFTGATAEDRAILENIMDAAILVERIYAKQLGVDGMIDKIAADDTMSRMMFYRNQGPWCAGPETEGEAACAAFAPAPAKISGLYPRSLQEKDPKFCETLSKRKDADQLMHQFFVVAEENGELKAVPYHVAYQAEMEAVAQKLEAAAGGIQSTDEAAFKEYLTAAAKAFRTNDWEPADEAWAKMNVNNSKWYLRIAPDETYFEPCSRKAGFHVTFARINQGSKEWQNKLDPVKSEMELALAKLIGKPYVARKVDFHLPDFIDIIVNAGDARDPIGATIGQSLPNWGPVANEGRGRTVAMTNINTDADSATATEKQAQSLLCAETMKSFVKDPKAALMGTVLHEATHNLGPAHEYKVNGKTDDQTFGGPLASTLEELKAETGSFFFADWLAQKGLILEENARAAHVRDVVWGFGHISRGLYDSEGKPKPYSQLAALQLGWMVKQGAAEWKKDELAANGQDKGCVELHLDKLAPTMEKLMAVSGGFKAKGDKKGAEALLKELVGAPADKRPLYETIKERWLRAPKASFVYSVDL